MHRCYYCGGEQVEQLTTFVYEDDDQFWVVRNVPALVCIRCGEKEYTQDVTHRVLTLRKQPPRPREILHVPAYELVAA